MKKGVWVYVGDGGDGSQVPAGMRGIDIMKWIEQI